MNSYLGGVYFSRADLKIVNKYSQGQRAELITLTNRRLFELCDRFLVSRQILLMILNHIPTSFQPRLKYGNIFHGSSRTVLKNLELKIKYGEISHI